MKEKLDYNGNDRINSDGNNVDILNHMKLLPVGRVKNGEKDVSNGENVDDDGECQHRYEEG